MTPSLKKAFNEKEQIPQEGDQVPFGNPSSPPKTPSDPSPPSETPEISTPESG